MSTELLLFLSWLPYGRSPHEKDILVLRDLERPNVVSLPRVTLTEEDDPEQGFQRFLQDTFQCQRLCSARHFPPQRKRVQSVVLTDPEASGPNRSGEAFLFDQRVSNYFRALSSREGKARIGLLWLEHPSSIAEDMLRCGETLSI